MVEWCTERSVTVLVKSRQIISLFRQFVQNRIGMVKGPPNPIRLHKSIKYFSTLSVIYKKVQQPKTQTTPREKAKNKKETTESKKKRTKNTTTITISIIITITMTTTTTTATTVTATITAATTMHLLLVKLLPLQLPFFLIKWFKI